MIRSAQGDLLAAQVDALVNAVNTVGVMGKGLALAFKKRFPDNFEAYKAACGRNEVVVGRMHVFERAGAPRVIVNFPTKQDFRNPSKLDWIADGLSDLVEVVAKKRINSIAVPPLGCGLGGLDWADVRPLVVSAFEPLSDVDVLLYEPH